MKKIEIIYSVHLFNFFKRANPNLFFVYFLCLFKQTTKFPQRINVKNVQIFIQYMVPGFEHMTFQTWVVKFNLERWIFSYLNFWKRSLWIVRTISQLSITELHCSSSSFLVSNGPIFCLPKNWFNHLINIKNARKWPFESFAVIRNFDSI